VIFGKKPTGRNNATGQARPAGLTPRAAAPATPAASTPAPQDPSSSRLVHLWSDGLGTAGTRALQVILVIVLAAAVVFAMTRLSLVVLPLLLGVVLACALWPLIRLLRRWLSPMLSAWIVLLGAFLILGGVITGIVTSVMSQWGTLSQKAQEGFAQVQGWLKDLPVQIDQAQLNEWISKGTEFLTSSQFGAGALSGLSAAGNFFVGAGTLLVTLFFFLKDGDTIWKFFMSWVPERVRPTWNRAGSRARDVFGGYLRGTTIVAAVDAIGIGLVMVIIGVPLAFPLAILVFLGAYIPMVGAAVAGVLSVLVTLVSSGVWQAVVVAIATVVIQQLEGNLLQPVVMGNTLHLHGLVILITLTAGSVLGGIVGALISVPLVAAAWAIVKVCSGREGPDDDPAERKRRRKVRKLAKQRAKALAS
jgi:predicted PurR-regulated permease PerM